MNDYAGLLLALFGKDTDDLLRVYQMWWNLTSNDGTFFRELMSEHSGFTSDVPIKCFLADIFTRLASDLPDRIADEIIFIEPDWNSETQRYYTGLSALDDYDPSWTRADVVRKIIAEWDE